MIIFGVETSCDETAAAVIEGVGESVRVLSNIVFSQIDIHQKYGGVVPEVAAREHVMKIIPVIDEALQKAKIKSSKIDAIVVTVGPGLITSLMSGVETAKSLAMAWGKPIIGLNHITGHMYANFIERKSPIEFPALILTVSGGHNMLVLMRGHGDFKLVGETRDDAAGEAFDKGAKMLKLGYPGGPAISACADKHQETKNKLQTKSEIPNPKDPTPTLPLVRGGSRIIFPRPMMHDDNFDFSFSGLKTSLLYKLKKDDNWKDKIPEYAYGFQEAIVDVLSTKTIKAAKKFGAKTVMLSGGVSANKCLRETMKERVKQAGLAFEMPDLKYTTDNAAMIASAGYFRARENKFDDWRKLRATLDVEL